jgi:hypothetical protein
MVGDHDRACLFRHLRARLGHMGALLLRDDGIVTQLLEMLELLEIGSRRLVLTT